MIGSAVLICLAISLPVFVLLIYVLLMGLLCVGRDDPLPPDCGTGTDESEWPHKKVDELQLR